MLSRRAFMGCSICAAMASGGAGAHAAGRPQIIDVHAHVQVSSYLDLLAKAGLRRPNLQGSPASSKPSPQGDDPAALALRLQVMDEAGVRMQILSPTLGPYLADAAAGVAAARLMNDAQAGLVAQHPRRLASYVSLPLPHVEASLVEMRRGLDELGMVGVAAHTSCLGRSIADDRFLPLFEEMNRRGTALFLHPAVTGLASPFITEWNLQGAAGPLLEDITVALHLMAKGIPSRFPNVKIIVSHLGGGLASMVERLDNQLPLAVRDLPEAPSVTARRLWYDTVSHGSAVGLRAAVGAFGADRLLPGSDFPVLLGFEPYGKTFDYVRQAGLGRGVADRILNDNARKLFGFGPA